VATAVPATVTLTPPATAVPATSVPPPLVVAAPARDEVQVVEVVDGDTIKVRFGHGAVDTVRYIGMDTPETKDPRTSVQCFGAEAAAKNGEYVQEKTVYLERDVSERDRYDRLLRYVWVKGDDGAERMVNQELVAWGYAAATSFPPDVKYQGLFRTAEQQARAEKRGLWGACPSFGAPVPTATSVPVIAAPTPAPARAIAPTAGPAPASSSRTGSGRAAPISKDDCPASHPIKGNQGSRSTTDWIYHMPGGASYNATDPEECFATEADAQAAGYRRALR
jgi:micrococcal nuclease